MTLSRDEWHQRFLVQAQWTEGLRLYFFDLIKDDAIQSILEIGCGTGALLPDLQALTPGQVFGGDINLDHLELAALNCPDCSLSGANVHRLPFADQSFDLVLCHYFLMWTGEPSQALGEMRRVTKTGGSVVAFAEPDYGGRIDHPQGLSLIREMQIQAFKGSGADPYLGRQLLGLFVENGFSDLECGIYQGFFPREYSEAELESEWKVLAADLDGFLSSQELEELRSQDLAARQSGSRVVYVPTFYAWAKVPG